MASSENKFLKSRTRESSKFSGNSLTFNSKLGKPLGKLSFDYMQIIFILNATFDSIKINSDADMIKSWECWKQTSHPIFRRKLVRMGLDTKESSD
jgi:hypothetical protein